jgi:hypothetical protein
MDSYPLLDFLVRHGRSLALVLAGATLLACVLAAVMMSAWPWALAGAAASILVYGFIASYAELVRLVTDMLMPK